MVQKREPPPGITQVPPSKKGGKAQVDCARLWGSTRRETYPFEELTIFTGFLVILGVEDHLWLKGLGWGGHGEGVRAWVRSGWGGSYSAALLSPRDWRKGWGV